MQIATNMKALREQKGIFQEELAVLSGVPRGTIARIENNVDNPKIEPCLKIAKVLGTTCEKLAYGEDYPEN